MGPPFTGPPGSGPGAGVVPQGGAQGAQGSGSGRGPDPSGTLGGAQAGQGPRAGGGAGTVGELQKGVLSGQGAEEAGAEKVRKSVNINTLPHSEIHRDLRATMSLTSLSPLMPDSYHSICYRFVKLGPKKKYIKISHVF